SPHDTALRWEIRRSRNRSLAVDSATLIECSAIRQPKESAMGKTWAVLLGLFSVLALESVALDQPNPDGDAASSHAGDLKPYPFPNDARASLENLAASSDILILGEMHGTQEVPELVASLLARLTELGYNTLAIEVPNNEQASLRAWACGETKRSPD